MSSDNQVRTISALMAYTAERYGEKTAISYFRKEDEINHSYREFYENSCAFASYITEHCAPGTHIALLSKTSYKFLSIFNAVMMAECVAVPLSIKSNLEDTVKMINDSDSEVLVYDSKVVKNIHEITALCPGVKHTVNLREKEKINAYFEAYHKSGKVFVSPEKPDTTAVIIYSSGTTGERKGAMLSSWALVSNVFFKEMSFEGDHVALNILPMNHIFSFSCDYLKNLKDGVKICLCRDLQYLSSDLIYFEPTVIRLVPMMVDSLLRRVRILRKRNTDLSPREAAARVFGRRLTNIIVSGAAYTASNEKEFEEMGITIRQGYGMTETGPRIAVPDGKTCAQSGGRIISICTVRIKDGEIQVKSPSLMSGYYKREQETKEVFTEDGFFKTGDLGYVTDDNELFITGRKKNIIILSNGENVSPEEIEMKYYPEPLIREIEVYEENGKISADIYPDNYYAQNHGIEDVETEIMKIIETGNAGDTAEREIDKVYIREEPLPKTETGKIKRRQING